MTIRYKVLVKGADDALKKHLEEEYCCYGSIGQKFQFTERTDSGYKTTRRFPVSKFEGIKLELAHDTPYGQGTTKIIRDKYEKMFKGLGFYRWLGVNKENDGMSNEAVWFKQTRDQFAKIDSITFKKGCPMFLAVAATGIWRMFANAPNLHRVYSQLAAKEGIHPIAAFSAAINVDSSSMGPGSKIDGMTFRVCHYQTHMPWGHRCMDVRATARLMQLTHEDFKSLPSMYDEQKEKNTLNYDGRDNWFFGTKVSAGSGPSIDSTMNYLTTEDWQKNLCEPVKDGNQWHSRFIKGENLIKWCYTLSREAGLLKGYDLMQDRATTRSYINEAKKKDKDKAGLVDPYGRASYGSTAWRTFA